MSCNIYVGETGWKVKYCKYHKKDKVWKVTWQNICGKPTKRNQVKVNYQWHELPRELIEMYTPDGMIVNEYNGPLIAIKRNNHSKRKVKKAERKLKGPRIGPLYQAEISNSERNKLTDKNKMELIEAQMVHQAFQCKKRKREEREKKGERKREERKRG